MRTLCLAATLLLFAPASHAADQCRADELTFHFHDVQLGEAFAVLANFSGYQLVMDKGIVWSGPIDFVCKPWKQAAQEIAAAHSLHVSIRDNTIFVTK